EALAGPHGPLHEVGHAVLIVWQAYAMPMDGRRFVGAGQLILQCRFQPVAEFETNQGRPCTFSEGPERKRGTAETRQRGGAFGGDELDCDDLAGDGCDLGAE